MRRGENVVRFPHTIQPVPAGWSHEASACAGHVIGALYEPEHETAGGVLLPVTGSGWSDDDIHSRMRAESELASAVADGKALADRLSKESRLTWEDKRLLAAAAERVQQAQVRMGMVGQAQSHGAGMTLRPDAAVVLSSGTSLSVGDSVIVAPYSGHRFRELFGVRDFCVWGNRDDWLDVVMMRWSGEIWEPLGNWCVVAVEPKRGDVLGDRRFHNWGTVIQSGPDASYVPGSVVVLDKDRMVPRLDDSRWFALDGPYPTNCVLVREVDSDGVRRLIGFIGVVQVMAEVDDVAATERV